MALDPDATKQPESEPFPRVMSYATTSASYWRLALWLVIAVLVIAIALVLLHARNTGKSGIGTDVGQQAPDFTLMDLTGAHVSLHNFKGKPVMLLFYGVGCPPCQKELPDLKQALASLAIKPAILAIDEWREDPALIQSYAATQKVPGILLLDPAPDTSPDRMYTTIYHGYAVPAAYYIDASGIIRARVDGGETAGTFKDNFHAIGVA